MTQYNFGTGQLYTMPEAGGVPLRIGALQDVSFEFSSDKKELYGQYQFPLDTARGKSKIEGKFGSANIDVAAWNSFYFGQTVVSDTEIRHATNEAGAVPASSAYTVTAANGATFERDLGAFDVLSGAPLRQVASSPDDGEYTVSSVGVYTFNVAQAGRAVLLNYLYTATTSGAGTLEINNKLMGDTPKFQLIASQVYKGKAFTLIMYSVTSDKLSIPLKQDDHTIPDIGWSASANSAGQIGLISTSSALGGGA